MSVDKFGRFSKAKRVERGPKGEGFALTSEGDYDIKAKRMRFLKDPQDPTDAVNLKFLKENSLVGENGIINANGNTITNLNDPVESSDAVTKSYFSENTPNIVVDITGQKAWNCRQLRLTDVKSPRHSDDAINLAYIKHFCPNKEIEGWNFRDHRLIYVATPMNDNDAATLGEVKRLDSEVITTLGTSLSKTVAELQMLNNTMEAIRRDVQRLNQDLDKVRNYMGGLVEKRRLELKRYTSEMIRKIPTSGRASVVLNLDEFINWNHIFDTDTETSVDEQP